VTGSGNVLYVVEPSKVRYQHIFVIDGYLRAICAAADDLTGWNVQFWGSRSTIAALSPKASQGCEMRSVPVMDPEKKRLIRKCLLEVAVVLSCMIRMRRRDTLIITCLLSPALMLLQTIATLLPRRNVFVVLHGELEWLGPSPPDSAGVTTVGYWAKKWLWLRRPDSPMKLIVLDGFIRDRLLQEHPADFRGDGLWAVRPPVVPLRDAQCQALEQGRPAKICFVGYRTRFKSFDNFLLCVAGHPDWQFLAIGGGAEVDVRTGEKRALDSNEDYLAAIAACDVALFPYDAGYSMSLSASGLDALIAGVHIVALERPFFVGLRDALGEDVVTVWRNMAEIDQYMQSLDIQRIRSRRQLRTQLVAASPFGIESVTSAFKDMISVGAVGSGLATKGYGGVI
jgi:hypothetical protein